MYTIQDGYGLFFLRKQLQSVSNSAGLKDECDSQKLITTYFNVKLYS